LLRERAQKSRPATEPITSLSNTSTDISTSAKFDNHEHVNFFSDLENGKYASTKVNAERVEEKKQEQEKYEKQIGYLTYLGQDTNEINKTKDWYDKIPERGEKFDNEGKKIEVNLKSKLIHDPMTLFQKYVGVSLPKNETITKEKSSEKIIDTKQLSKYESVLLHSSHHKRKSIKRKSSKKHKKEKKSRKEKKKKHKKEKKSRRKSSSSSSSSSSSDSDEDDEEARLLQKQKLDVLRKERLERERIERQKEENLLKKLRGETIEPEKKPDERPHVKQKYNSQFNPEIARQNQD
jgi:hypothetical protein